MESDLRLVMDNWNYEIINIGVVMVKEIYRTYADTEVSRLSTEIECPYCGDDWMEEDMDECGKTYKLECEKCGKEFTMYFDAD